MPWEESALSQELQDSGIYLQCEQQSCFTMGQAMVGLGRTSGLLYAVFFMVLITLQ